MNMKEELLGVEANNPEVKPLEPKSYKVGCKTKRCTDWAYNALRFPTVEAAETYAKDLYSRWTALDNYEIHPSDDPVSAAYRYAPNDN